MSVFVTEDQIADVRFFVKSNKSFIKILKPEAYSDLSAAEKAQYDEFTVKLRPLTWGRACQLQSASHSIDPATNMRAFDSDKYVQMKLRAIISEWNFKVTNAKGEDVVPKINEEAVNALHPTVAEFILKEYNERFEYNDEKRKN